MKEVTEKLIAGSVKSGTYVKHGRATACVHEEILTAQVSAFGQVSECRSLRKDVEVAQVEAIRFPDADKPSCFNAISFSLDLLPNLGIQDASINSECGLSN